MPDGQLQFYIPLYSESGYTLTPKIPQFAELVSPTYAQNYLYGPTSTRVFFAFKSDNEISLTKSDGGIFSLSNFDVGINSGSDIHFSPETMGSFKITAIGSDYNAVSFSFVISDPEWHTISLANNPGFNNLRQVNFLLSNTGPLNSGLLVGAIDNINVSEVPIPASAWLFGSGLLCFNSLKKRRSV